MLLVWCLPRHKMSHDPLGKSKSALAENCQHRLFTADVADLMLLDTVSGQCTLTPARSCTAGTLWVVPGPHWHRLSAEVLLKPICRHVHVAVVMFNWLRL